MWLGLAFAGGVDGVCGATRCVCFEFTTGVMLEKGGAKRRYTHNAACTVLGASGPHSALTFRQTAPPPNIADWIALPSYQPQPTVSNSVALSPTSHRLSPTLARCTR